MREQQLVIFCSGFEANLEKVCCFVEAKLKHARELMERYLRQRK